MVKVGNLLAEDEVLEKRRATITSREDLLILNRTSDVRRHETLRVVDFELG